MTTTRRGFLAAAGAGALLGEIAQIRSALATLHEDVPAGSLPGADAYLLDPAIGYLNHASVGTIPRIVQEAHMSYLRLCERNPWFYIFGEGWEEPREGLRAKAAQAFGTVPERIAITHNVTEAFNLLAQGLPFAPGDEVLFSELNHPGASVPFIEQAKRRGFSVRRFSLPLEAAREMTADELAARHAAAIGPATRLLVLPHVDNLAGLVHPVAEIARRARERDVAFVAVDGAQAAGALDLSIDGLGVDLYAMNGHKWLQAPKGTGLACLSEALQAVLCPMWTTWGQERWAGTVRIFEDYGTRNMPEILALEDALDFQARIPAQARRARYAALAARIRTRIEGETDLVLRSSVDGALGGVPLLSLSFVREPARRTFARLFGEAGFVFRPFSEPLDMIRLSPNLMTSDAEIDRFFDRLLSV